MPAQSLEQAAAAFAIWRSKRKGPRAHTPKELQQQAVALLSEYPERTVIDALKVSRESLNRWQVQQTPETAITDKTAFAVLPTSSPEPDTKPSLLIIEYPNGMKLHLQGEPSITLLSSVLASLTRLGELPA